MARIAPGLRRGLVATRALLRSTSAFLLACLAAGVTEVLFALTPAQLVDSDGDKLSTAGVFMLLTAVQCAVFAAPLALPAAAIGEWRGIRAWTYYAGSGIAIALAGFMAQFSGANAGYPLTVNRTALTALMTAGFVGGFVYWLLAGRHAGFAHAEPRCPGRMKSFDRP